VTTASSIDLFSISPPDSPKPEISIEEKVISSPINAQAKSFVPASALSPSVSPVRNANGNGRGRGRGRGSSNPFGLSQDARGPKKVVATAETAPAEGEEDDGEETPRKKKVHSDWYRSFLS